MRINKWPSESTLKEKDDDLLFTLEQDRFLDTYRHFGTLFDLLAALAGAIKRLRQSAGLETATELRDLQTIQARLLKWHRKEYKKDFDRFQRSGFPVNFTIHHRSEPLEGFLPVELMDQYKVLRKEISEYRNLLHAPAAGQIWKGGEHLIPKPEFVSNYELWTRMVKVTPEMQKEQFWPLEDAFRNHFQRVCSLVENVWPHFLRSMDALAQLEIYREWTAVGPTPAPPAKHITLGDATVSGQAAMDPDPYSSPTSTSYPMPKKKFQGLSGIKAEQTDE